MIAPLLLLLLCLVAVLAVAVTVAAVALEVQEEARSLLYWWRRELWQLPVMALNLVLLRAREGDCLPRQCFVQGFGHRETQVS
jgi:hypothetical protein